MFWTFVCPTKYCFSKNRQQVIFLSASLFRQLTPQLPHPGIQHKMIKRPNMLRQRSHLLSVWYVCQGSHWCKVCASLALKNWKSPLSGHMYPGLLHYCSPILLLSSHMYPGLLHYCSPILLLSSHMYSGLLHYCSPIFLLSLVYCCSPISHPSSHIRCDASIVLRRLVVKCVLIWRCS